MSKILRVSPDMKGELSLPIRKSSFKPNTLITLEDEEYRRREVQLALSLGFLKEVKPPEENLPKATVIKHRPKPKLPDPKKEVEDVEDVEDMEDIEVKEPVVKKKFEKLTKQTETLLNNNMGGWDAESKELLDETHSRKKALDNVNGIEMELQIGKELDFTKEKDDNEVKAPTITKKKRAKRKSAKSTKKTTLKKKDTTQKSIKPVGKKKDLSEYLDLSDSEKPDGILAFVDEEDEKRRIASHPILGKKLANQNEEVG